MNALKTAYESDFDIVGVPSNVFGLQEPGANNVLLSGYEHVHPGNGYRPNFAIAAKVDVNGENQVPVYTYLKGQCGRTTDNIGTPSSMYWSPVMQSDISWNFEKFLIDRKGKPYKRYNPSVDPTEIIPDIEALIAQPKVAENDVVETIVEAKPVKNASLRDLVLGPGGQ